MATGIIYMILNEANGKAYIGSTLNEVKRLKTHMRHLRKGKHKNTPMQKDFNLYGAENFTVKVIARDIPEDDLHIWEISEIAVYDYDGPGVYNIGRARRITSEQRRRKTLNPLT